MAALRTVAAVVLAAVLAGGCRLPPPRGELVPGGLPVFPPSARTAGLTWTHQITVSTPGERSRHRLLLNASRQQVRLVVFGPMDQRAATFEYNGGQLTADTLMPYELPVPAAEMITILQLVAWPAAALKPHLPSDQWTLSEREGQRTLRKNGRIAATIGYHGAEPPAGRSVYRTREGYKIIIQSVRIQTAL